MEQCPTVEMDVPQKEALGSIIFPVSRVERRISLKIPAYGAPTPKPTIEQWISYHRLDQIFPTMLIAAKKL